MDPAELAALVRRRVDAAPPLSARQQSVIRALLVPAPEMTNPPHNGTAKARAPERRAA